MSRPDGEPPSISPDTRGAVNPAIHRDQTELSGPDIMDKRLPAGKTVTKPGIDWTLVATIRLVCYQLFVICHLPSGRSDRPAQPFFRPSGEPHKW
jgi:hypothetical protein